MAFLSTNAPFWLFLKTFFGMFKSFLSDLFAAGVERCVSVRRTHVYRA
jgi:hypothetical protein